MKLKSYREYFESIIELNGDYLTEALGNDYLEWSYLRPVFFIASTGTGKSTMFERIIVECIKRKMRVLLLSNRSAIDLAMKKRLAKAIKRTDILDERTNQGLRNLDKLDDYLFIMTYQKLSKLIDNKSSDFHKIFFGLVVCDEIGFISADAQLTNTSKAIKHIVNNYTFSIKCYASATPDPIYQYIYALEENIFKKREYHCTFGNSCHNCGLTKFKSPAICDGKICCNKNFYGVYDCFQLHDPEEKFQPLAYEMLKGYEYLKIHFLHDYEEYVKMIINGVIKNKSVIFFDTIERGKDMHNNLPNSVYIDADTKNIKDSENKNKKEHDYIIDHETFKSDTMLCSSTFDCGINMKYSSGIHNIVISTADRNQFIQMLGRIRVKDGDIVNLYIVDIKIEELKKRLKEVKLKLSAIRKYESNKSTFEDTYYNESIAKFNFHLVQGIFNIRKGEIEFNEAAKIQLVYLEETLENIITEYENGEKQSYLKNVLKWLDRDDYSEDKWINFKSSDELHSDFIEYLKKMDGKRFDKKDDYNNFRIELQTLFNKSIFSKNVQVREKDLWGVEKINKLLKQEGFNYMLEKIDNCLVFHGIKTMN